MTWGYKTLLCPTSKERHTKTRHRSLEEVDVSDCVLAAIVPIVFAEVKRRLLQASGKVRGDIDLSDVVSSSLIAYDIHTSIRNSSGYSTVPLGKFVCGSEPEIRTRPSGIKIASEWYMRATIVLLRMDMR